jgi:formylmethanofuran dehydrogenase subunit E
MKTRCDRCGRYPISGRLIELSSGESVCERCIGKPKP